MIEQHAHKRQSTDWAMIGVYLALVLIGWFNIYASVHSSEPASMLAWSSRAGKQFVWILTSLGLAAIILFVLPPRLWEGVCIPFYILVVFLLIVVIFVSSDVKGSHSWFDLGPIRFQPAEISKISTSLLLSFVLSQQNFRLSKFKDFMLAAAVIVFPMLIIVAESETGSALVYTGFIFVLYREGFSGWWLGLIGLVIALFIATLTAGAYWSVVGLIAVLVPFCVLTGNVGHPWRRILVGGLFVLFMAFLPSLLEWGCTLVDAHTDYLNHRIWVPQAHESAQNLWSFLPEVKPIYFLLILSVGAAPFLLYHAYWEKDQALAITVGAFLLGVALIFSTDYIFENVLQPHQQSRIEVLLGMKEDLAGVGYNVHQSKIAIGSGGLLGKGFLQGTQTTFGFVPEQTTDFIFCTVGEEWGFLGCLVVIALYTFLIARLILDAESCRGNFTRIYGYCVAACVFMHLFINVGMTVGLMPVIGIPLPLLSYGGSSLWAFTILIFIFLALYRNEKKYF